MSDSLMALPRTPKRIGIAADHEGYKLKEQLTMMLREATYEVIDFGDHQLNQDDDYPDFMVPLARAVSSTKVDRGIMLSRTSDTVAKFMIPKVTLDPQKGSNGWTIVVALVNPLPLTDDWALLADGTIAIVRGREYRVDFVDEADRVTHGPRVPFEWERVRDDARDSIIDSTRTEMEKLREAQIARNAAAAAGAPAAAGPTTGANGRQLTGADGGARSGALGPAGPQMMPLEFVPPSDLPDYRPAFRQGAALGDAEGRLWIRTTKVINGGAVYDVIDRSGALVDRVKVPPGRVIAGFGPRWSRLHGRGGRSGHETGAGARALSSCSWPSNRHGALASVQAISSRFPRPKPGQRRPLAVG